MTWEADLAQQRFTKLIGSHFDTWGFSQEEWLSPGFWVARIHPEDFPAVAEICGATITNQTDGHFECRMTAADGSVMWFDGLVGPIIDDGTTVGLRGSLADITEQKHRTAIGRNTQRMDAVGRLAGGVAHDFNNLLTVIKTYSDLIAYNTVTSDPNTRYVDAIRTAVDRAVTLTDQLLLFSTQSVGSKSTVDLNSVLRKTRPTLETMVGEGIDLSVDLDPNLSIIRGDHGSLEQIILNLVHNSLDAIGRQAEAKDTNQSGRITLRTRNVWLEASAVEIQNEELVAREYVEFLCHDDGVGMEPDVVAQAFEPFFTTHDVGEGQGIGLTVVYGIVQQLGGSVSIRSQDGEGARICVLLPLATLDPDRGTISASGELSGGTETILVVEDDQDTRQAVELILSRLGYQVLVGSDPLEALAIVDTHDGAIDLLVSDVEMPIMFGHELLRQLRPILPELRVLFTSGYSAATLQKELLGEQFLAKPFTLSTLAKSVRDVLDSPPHNVTV